MSSLCAMLSTLLCTNDRYLEMFNVFRKEKESCDEMDELEKEEGEETGPRVRVDISRHKKKNPNPS